MSSLQQSGKISLIEVANEFGVTSGPRSLLSFYRGGGNVSATDVITSSATSAPSNNTPVSDFAGTTGLTLTYGVVTMTPNSSGNVTIHNKSRTNQNVSTQGEKNKKYIYQSGDKMRIYSNNNSFSSAQTQTGTWTSGTVDYANNTPPGGQPTGDSTVYTATTWRHSVRSSSDQHPLNGRATASLLCPITGDGELVITAAGNTAFNGGNGYVGFTVQIQTGDSSDAIVKRDDGTTFANSNSYAITIAGSTTETVQGGQSITSVLPNSSNNYVVSFTPTTNNQTSTITPPTSDSAVSDFGSVTGLTCTRTSTTSTSDTGFVLVRNLNGNGGPVNFYVSPGNGSTRITDLELRTTGNAVVCVSTSQQTSCSPTAGTKTLNNYTQVGSYNYRSNDGTVKEFARTRITTTTFTYNFTNNTGHDVTISGSGITDTTLTNGSSTSTDIAHPSGNFTIQHVVDNPVAVNGNIPSAGRISLTNFYGTNG